MPPSAPIIVIGAGHNGLTAAAYLAKAGRRVLVVEARHLPGGIAATETLIPGYRFNTGFSNTAALLPRITEDLQLKKHGYSPLRPPAALYAARPGGGFALDGTGQPAFHQPDASQDFEKTQDFVRHVERMAGILAAIFPLSPPPLKGGWSLDELWPWVGPALKVRGLGKRDMMDFIRILPMSAREFLDEWFTDDGIKGPFALLGSMGQMNGPLGAGSTLNLLYHLAGGFQPVFASGGAGSLSAALHKAVLAFGGEVRLGTRIAGISLENGQAAGVITRDGETIPASQVVSSLDPRRTLHELVGARHLPVAFNRRLNNLRLRGSTATVHFALRRLPDFQTDPRHLTGWIAFCPGIMTLEKAYDAAKYGRLPENPALLGTIPTLLDSSLAPDTHHTMSLIVRYTPHNLRDGDLDALTERVIRTIETAVPDFRETVIASHTIDPGDYAQIYGLSEGAWTHGQLALDQILFMRPVPGWAQYRTPIPNLVLCGSGSHPGGGITGAPGANAARTILDE